MNKRLIVWIIFVVIILATIAAIAIYKEKSGINSNQENAENQTHSQDPATTDINSADEDFTAIDEGLEGLN